MKAQELGHRDNRHNPHRSLLPTYTTTVCPQPPKTGVQTKVLHADHHHCSLYVEVDQHMLTVATVRTK